MATVAPHISVDEYRKLVTDPDCELVDGVIEERPMGEYDHSTWQTAIAEFFNLHKEQWGVKARTELRLQVSPTRFRVPDVMLLSRTAPREQVITHAPLAVFEVLSPDDTMSRMLIKLADYERMGIRSIWLIEPQQQLFYRYSAGKLESQAVFELDDFACRFAWSEIIATID
jgi:Uma2 family endonuclease